MIRLRLLGGVDLRGADGHELRSVLAQPKRLALLAYLAAATPRGFHRRDTLLGIFWPEQDDARARGALNRAVHYLRRALGPESLAGRGDAELGLAPDRVRCDVADFEDAIRARRDDDALELYRGELLQGFFLSDAAEFERWLEVERARLRREAAAAAWRLVDGAEAAGDLPLAARRARRAVDLSGDDEPALRRLLELLAASGDRAGAIEAYTAFAARLREGYELEPSSETRALADAIRRGERDPEPAGGGPGAALSSGHVPESARLEAAPHGAAPQPRIRPPSTPSAALVSPEAVPDDPRSRGLPRRRWGAVVAVAAAALVVIGAAAAWLASVRGAPPARDPHRVAVLPFRVVGTAPSLRLLGEGMVDLLTSRLDVDGGSAPVDPHTVVAEWRRSVGEARLATEARALEVADRIGAGQAVLGEVVQAPAGIIIHAALYSVPGGRVPARASAEGAPDSLSALVDRLTAQLLVRSSGEGEHRVGPLTGVPLPALHDYLEGRWALRRGRYEEAARYYASALEVDSTFALAGLGLAGALAWAHPPYADLDRARVAWRFRNRLSPRDTLAVTALAGPRFPAPTPFPELLRAREQAAAASPESPELWFFLGDLLFHEGPIAGAAEWERRAASAFERAVALDPGFAAPLQHLAELAALRGDTAAVRRYAAAFARFAPRADMADAVRWTAAIALGDSAAVAAERRRAGAMSLPSLRLMARAGETPGATIEDAWAAANALRERAATSAERASALLALENLALNRGRPAEARRLLDDVAEAIGPAALSFRINDALYWEGDTVSAAAAARASAAQADAPTEADPDRLSAQTFARCDMLDWRLAHGDEPGAVALMRRLEETVASDAPPKTPAVAELCAAGGGAALAVTRGSPDAGPALERLDSLARVSTAPVSSRLRASLAAARLWEARGELARALAAVRRSAGPLYRSTFLREEGRLAARLGDTAAAARAYRAFLALRPDPETAAREDAARLRSELARLAAGERKRDPRRAER